MSAKKIEPKIPLAATVAAAFFLDLLWPILLLLGLESVRVSPGDTAFTGLAFESYPWSHSLLAVLGWSGLAVLIGRRLFGSNRAGVVLGVVVLSHWILDWVTHRPDLPLWPGGPVTGLGLWYSIPGTIVIEASLLAAGLWLYITATAPLDRTGKWALAILVGLTALIWITQPWAPPPPSATAVAAGAMILWLLPPWGAWIERHRTSRGGAGGAAMLVALLLLLLPGFGAAQTRTADETELLRLHAQLIQAHLDGDVESWMDMEAEDFVSVNSGEVTHPSVESRRSGRAAYLADAQFSIYRDIAEPLVRVSDDGSLGWLIASVEVEGTWTGANGDREPFRDVWAWVELYERQAEGWRLVGNASNLRPEAPADPAQAGS